MYHPIRAVRPGMLLLILALSAAFRLPLAAAADLPDPVAFRVQIENGNADRVRAWLDAGLPPGFLGDKVGSGLMIAAREGNIALMELFVARGADVNQTNRLGETALMHAAWKDKLEAVRWLLARGARVNSPAMQWSALHYAVFAGNAELAALLLEKGADINAVTPNGSSVLMMAVYEGKEELANWLVGRGADTSIRNENGDGALDWAVKFNHPRIARMVAAAPSYRSAAARPKPDWGSGRRSETASSEVEELLRIREILAARNLSLEKIDRRIAAARAKSARAAVKPPPPAAAVSPPKPARPAAKTEPLPVTVLEVVAERFMPTRQEVRIITEKP